MGTKNYMVGEDKRKDRDAAGKGKRQFTLQGAVQVGGLLLV